jgi:hypothetical protein
MKAMCYQEHLWGTNWEHDGNTLGTWKKPSPPNPTQNLKEKISRHFWVHAEPFHWLHEISISKTVCHHFWPGLIPPL